MAVHWCRSIAALALVAGLTGFTAPAAAQGFLQNHFGWGSPSNPSRPPGLQSPYSYREPLFDPYRVDPRGADPFRDVGGVYRTVCVRLCDGYYWPISQATGRDGLDRDAYTCRSSCGQDARLYYLGSRAGDATEMIDLQGRPYTNLRTAFRYRKKLVDGCQCRPEPWSAAERERHRRYAQDNPNPDRIERNAVAFSGPPIPLLPSGSQAAADPAQVLVGGGGRVGEADRLPSRSMDDHPEKEPLPRSVKPSVKVPVPATPHFKAIARPAPASIKAPRFSPVGTNGPLSSKAWSGG